MMRLAFITLFVMIVFSLGVPLAGLFLTESGKNQIKDFWSDIGGGLERKITFYQKGKPVKTWTGKTDIEFTCDSKVKFTIKDKRIIVCGNIVTEEQ